MWVWVRERNAFKSGPDFDDKQLVIKDAAHLYVTATSLFTHGGIHNAIY